MGKHGIKIICHEFDCWIEFSTDTGSNVLVSLDLIAEARGPLSKRVLREWMKEEFTKGLLHEGK